VKLRREVAWAAVAALALVGWAVIIARSWDTWITMNHATGTVAVLADAALHGEAAGHEGESLYLGALYAPPFPLLVAALYRTGLSWLHALRVASLLSALLLLAAIALASRAAGASRGGAVVAVTIVVGCNLFKVGSLGGRADLLAAAFTTAAIAAWLRDREHRGWAAPVLAAAAWLCKLSEIAMPLALVALTIATRDPRPLARFIARFALACAAGVAVMSPFHAISWYTQALSTTLLAPPNLSNILRGPAEVLRYVGSFSELAVLAAAAIAALADPARRSRADGAAPLRFGTGAALLVALLVLANRGADHNHLLTAIALAAVCASTAWDTMPARVLAMTALLTVVPATWRDTAALIRQAASPAERRAEVIAAVRAEPGPVLAEDPLLLLAAGRRSPITDPSTLRSRARAGDERAKSVLQATAEGRWSLILLEQDADRAVAWYRDFHFGDAFTAALRERYARADEKDFFVLYRRRTEAVQAP
jgi:hypothetical protein